MKNNDKFNFTYSAPTKSEREEIEDIRKAYLPKAKSDAKLMRLKKLDSIVKNTPMAISLSLGIVGMLIFGLGMTMVLEWQYVVFGIIVSVFGLVPVGLAYFVYKKILNRLTEKHREEILKLSEELLNEEKRS